jgi:hypothetical protein
MTIAQILVFFSLPADFLALPEPLALSATYFYDDFF